jgi:transposase InsO family protein
MEAVLLVRKGWSIRTVARHTGFQPSTISRWMKRAPEHGNAYLPTRSPRPASHPRSINQKTIQAIVDCRLKHRRCAEVIHHLLKDQGIRVSLSSVKRILKRKGLLKEKSKWKKYHPPIKRPIAASAGDLVQLDTIHIHTHDGGRFYVYTLLDVHSRWAHAKVSPRITAGRTLKFLEEARAKAPFVFKMLQSDHGPEFSKWFTKYAKQSHRYSRVRKPNDNAHLERFNRTIQEECLYYLKQKPSVYQKAIEQYLPFYNNERPHLGLNLLSPIKCCQAID